MPTSKPAARYPFSPVDVELAFDDTCSGETLARRAGAARMLACAPSWRVVALVEGLDRHRSFDALAGAVRRPGLDPVEWPADLRNPSSH